MLRKVTLKPFTRAANVSPASLMIEDIGFQSNKEPDARQIGVTRWISQTPLRRSLVVRLNLAAGQRSDDLLAVKAAIFDENFTRMVSANHHARQKNTGHIAFVRLRIHGWFVCRRVERDTERAQKLEVRVVPGQRKYVNGRQRGLARVIRNPDMPGFDAPYFGFEKRANLTGFDAVLNVRPDPILDRRAKFGAAMHESYSRA